MTDTPVSRITGAIVSYGTDNIELTLDFGIRRDFVLSPELAIEIADSLCHAVTGLRAASI